MDAQLRRGGVDVAAHLAFSLPWDHPEFPDGRGAVDLDLVVDVHDARR